MFLIKKTCCLNYLHKFAWTFMVVTLSYFVCNSDRFNKTQLRHSLTEAALFEVALLNPIEASAELTSMELIKHILYSRSRWALVPHNNHPSLVNMSPRIGGPLIARGSDGFLFYFPRFGFGIIASLIPFCTCCCHPLLAGVKGTVAGRERGLMI